MVLLTLALATALMAQDATVPALDVASIRAHVGPYGVINRQISGNLIVIDAYSVRQLIVDAYHLRSDQVIWNSADDTVYDIQARAGGGVLTDEQARASLRALLAERFHLKFHHETREKQVYVLKVGKDGPKLKESDSAATPSGHGGIDGQNQFFEASKESMDDLARRFIVDRPVLNQTGLTGLYDFKIASVRDRADGDPERAYVSPFTAVQDLGLRLEAQKANVDVIVVDSVEHPSEN